MYYEERKEVVAEAPVVEAPVEPWRQHLLGAAQVLRENGWCQNIAQIGSRRCVQAAIGCVIPSPIEGTMSVAFHEANHKLAHYLGLPGDITHMWNDQPCRTAEQVIAALEGAARS